jgi:outer membrane receptor for ferrienterochelin and colicins
MDQFAKAFAVCILLIVGVPELADAQFGSITGVARSAETQVPLVAAVVQVVAADGDRVATALTNQSGRFLISSIPPGSYSVSVSMTGYETGRIGDVNVVAGETSVASVDLATRAIDIDPVVISASRRQERSLDAPARTEVVTEQEIEVRPAVTPVDHLRSVPGVDVATSGVQSTNVVARGFNNIFSGALYTLSDHRIAGVPSLRVNLMHFVPVTNEDIERMEIVLGPGSALYGPNTANGVLHMLTRSPLTSQGTTVSVTGGERDLVHGSFRTAHLLGENVGFKISGQYLRAKEWQYGDPVETAERAKFDTDLAFWRADMMRAVGITQAEADQRIGRIGSRDFDVRRWSGEARADWRITPDLSGVLSAGTMTSNGIELTGLGAAQAVDWRYTYYQARASWGTAFAQVYLNASDAGETFLLRNGAPIRDRSKLFVTQVQHGVSVLGGRQRFTYGADLLRTLPVTEGTINGAYEDDDETTEIGGYVQSETRLTPELDLVLAGRLDGHSELPDPIFSPRAAIVFRPAADQSLRISFNRAFSTPNALTQFLDLGSPIPIEAAARLGYSLRIQGTGDDGFSFRDADGYRIRSPFADFAGVPGLSSATLLPVDQARLFWGGAVQAFAAAAAGQGLVLPPQLVQALASQVNAGTIELDYVNPALQNQRGEVSSLDLPDIPAIRESTSTTFELGYKGILAQRLLLAADVWWARRENLVTPLTISTPFIHFNVPTALPQVRAVLEGFYQNAGMTPEEAAALAQQQAPVIAGGIGEVPVGVISSSAVNANSAQLLMTYFNVDDELDLYGTDVALTALLSSVLSFEASASLVSDDVFETRRGSRVTLNAPKRKASFALVYKNNDTGIDAEGRVRYNAAYPVDSGVYRGTACLGDRGEGIEPCVGDFTLVDLTLGYRIAPLRDATVQLAIQNLFNTSYRSFPGVPDIGRMALLRVRYTF